MPTQPAVLGSARLNNFRLAYLPAELQRVRDWRIGFWLDGEPVRHRVRVGSVEIHDILNDAPNTASWRMEGTPPPEVGMQVRITINSNAPRLLFNGTLETTAITYEGRPAFVVYACSATDDTMRADYRRPFGYYQNVSATDVAIDLMARFAPGLTANHVQPGLAAVTVAFDGSEGFNGCLRAITKIIGGYFYWEDGDLHLFLEEATEAPDPLTPATPTLYHDPPIAATTDESQLRTRVYGRGYGEPVPVDVLPGDTMIPIKDASMYSPGGGAVIVAETAGGSPTRVLRYQAIHPGTAGGAIIGASATPSAHLTAVVVAGAGLGVGVYYYAYTWVTAAGETTPSIRAAVITGTIGTPTATPTAAIHNTGAGYAKSGWVVGGTVRFAMSYTADLSGAYTSDTDLSPISAPLTLLQQPGSAPGFMQNIQVVLKAPSDPNVTVIHGWVSYNGGPFGGMVGSSSVLPPGTAVTPGATYRVYLFDGTIGSPAAPPAPNPVIARVQLTDVALGPTGTTARKIYRTAVGGTSGSPLKLQQTIANNTSTVAVIDATPDASLGAAPPATDTAALPIPAGQVNPGSPTIPTAGLSGFPVSSWVLTAAGDYVRYTGISGNTLTGIQPAGPGAILTPLVYGDQVVPVAALYGIDTLGFVIAKGSPVHIFVQRDDFGAQAAAALRESTATYAADGIHEHMLVDERRAESSLTALCDADLAMFAYPLVTAAYVSMDVKTKSGKPIVIALPSPAIDATLTIQEVTITQLDIGPGVPARFATTASSVKFRLEDLLRRLSALLPE